MFAGQTIVGNWVSTTFTLKKQVPTLPAASVAVTETTVVPTGKTLPDTGLYTIVMAPGQLSVAVRAG